MIVQDKFVEIGYLVDSLYFRRRLNLYITFHQSILRAALSVKANSIRYWKNSEFKFDKPTVKKQFHLSLDVEKIKLYSLPGFSDSRRFLKSRLEFTLQADEKGELK